VSAELRAELAKTLDDLTELSRDIEPMVLDDSDDPEDIAHADGVAVGKECGLLLAVARVRKVLRRHKPAVAP
jgi:hypothetical protein